jgi:hypothetical protein
MGIFFKIETRKKGIKGLKNLKKVSIVKILTNNGFLKEEILEQKFSKRKQSPERKRKSIQRLPYSHKMLWYKHCIIRLRQIYDAYLL